MRCMLAWLVEPAHCAQEQNNGMTVQHGLDAMNVTA